MTRPDESAVVVFTAETKQSILSQGASGDWVVNPKSLERCQYLVCCRRADWKNRPDGIAHRTGFLVGRIAKLEKLDNTANSRGQSRFRIGIAEYADISLPEVWRKELRNPIAYQDLKELGIDLKRLKFQPIPEHLAPPRKGAPGKMTIAEAKKALAATFGVRVEDIEIIIKG
ncbi:hypothetical protein QWJ07_16985 [Frankia sp. RB7]|nr:hypothetical protein [Frankia sp. RB7]